jgi:hypothetical protein
MIKTLMTRIRDFITWGVTVATNGIFASRTDSIRRVILVEWSWGT